MCTGSSPQPRFGQVYTDFHKTFVQTNTAQFILEGMPAQPSPVILLSGFHVQTLTPCLHVSHKSFVECSYCTGFPRSEFTFN